MDCFELVSTYSMEAYKKVKTKILDFETEEWKSQMSLKHCCTTWRPIILLRYSSYLMNTKFVNWLQIRVCRAIWHKKALQLGEHVEGMITATMPLQDGDSFSLHCNMVSRNSKITGWTDKCHSFLTQFGDAVRPQKRLWNQHVTDRHSTTKLYRQYSPPPYNQLRQAEHDIPS